MLSFRKKNRYLPSKKPARLHSDRSRYQNIDALVAQEFQTVLDQEIQRRDPSLQVSQGDWHW